MKKAIKRVGSVLKGVSTLDIMISNPRIILLLLISMTALASAALGGHSTLDAVDPSFDPNIHTSSLNCKTVSQIIPLPDGKILVAGAFNSYNRQPVGGLMCLNADATLDTTFNSDLASGTVNNMVVLADGRIVIVTNPTELDPRPLIRLNADGTNDTTLIPYTGSSLFNGLLAVDAAGRMIVGGSFYIGGGYQFLIRLHPDGTRDTTFRFPLNESVQALALQNDKILIKSDFSNGILRLNEGGTIDPSFISDNFEVINLIVQPDGKILALGETSLRRLNQNGSNDAGFTTIQTSPPNIFSRVLTLSNDGRITLATRSIESFAFLVKSFLADGTMDDSFTPYIAERFSTMAVQADGGLLIGDTDGPCFTHPILNDFVRLSPDGSPDPTFDTGIGFQSFSPGVVRGINVQPDGKILIGGRFDYVNDVPRSNIARINADSTLDTTFEINTSGEFTGISNFDNIRTQSDGRILVTGDFSYLLDGTPKSNLVRLNSDGSIDPTFILGVTIQGPQGFGYGTLKFETFDDGKLLVGTTRFNLGEPAVPVKLTTTGEIDPSFIPGVFQGDIPVYIYDVAVQPDRKVIISGRRHVNTVNNKFGLNSAGADERSFLIRLNADGSLDPTFQTHEQLDNVVLAFVLMPDGKIVFSETDLANSQSNVSRLNADGTNDPTFNAGIANGRVNTMLVLSTGRIFAGGRFTTFDGQSRGNLVQLNADGSVFRPNYQLNDEVLCLAVDADGRVFVGGSFTIINAGHSGAVRSYVAGLIDARAPFDFDGDGRSDISVFRPSDRTWYLNLSTAGFSAAQFGLSTDKSVPADFDGDGKTDIAVFRDGVWYWINSSNGSFATFQFGVAGDIPVPNDFTGDRRADLAVYRAGIWYTWNLANGQFNAVQFGLSTDKPVAADYDGDGRTDQAVYRNGEWHMNRSTEGYAGVYFGLASDDPVPADYDGDGKTDVAVYRDGTWYLQRSSQGFAAFQFGFATDIPAPADYDGDGMTDAAVYRDGTWYLLNSTSGFSAQQFGLPADRPVAAAFLQ